MKLQISKLLEWILEKKSKFCALETHILSRCGLDIAIDCNFYGFSQFYKQRFYPYYTQLENSKNITIKIYLIYQDAMLPQVIGHGKHFYIVENQVDSRKNIEAKVYEADQYKLFTLNNSYILAKDDLLILLGSNKEQLLYSLRVLVKDISNSFLLKKGYVEMHASAVSQNNELYVCSGGSNRGKTSLLFHFLDTGKYQMVSNGRMYVKVKNNQLHGIGTPESIYIRPKSIGKHEVLKSLIARKNDLFFSTDQGGDDNKIRVNYVDLANAFSCDIVSDGIVNTVYLPYLDTDCKEYKISLETLNNGNDHFFSYEMIERRFWTSVMSVDKDVYNKNLQSVADYIMTKQKKSVVLRKGESYFVNGEFQI